MMELVRDTASVAAGSPDAVWEVIQDVNALRRILPGCESLLADVDGRLRGVLAAKIQFLTVRADVTARLEGHDAPRHVVVRLEGRPRSLAGSFSAVISVDLEPVSGGGTMLTYAVELSVTGRLATFGLPLLRQTMRDQVARLLVNLSNELVRRDGNTAA
jgi:carbon monoxide dehydrogenase subunit G